MARADYTLRYLISTQLCRDEIFSGEEVTRLVQTTGFFENFKFKIFYSAVGTITSLIILLSQKRKGFQQERKKTSIAGTNSLSEKSTLAGN